MTRRVSALGGLNRAIEKLAEQKKMPGRNPTAAEIHDERRRQLDAMKRELGITPQDARKEELARRPCWKIKKKKIDTEGVI